ncbi:uncharacterized protein [Cicer arietinum]|uniref:uncharacterized protein n=1 Tax=Cicer arietinum TaxID=3827 RepID=UPI003CC5DE93
MDEEKSVTVQLADFNKILDDLENLEVKLDDEDKALILLRALPMSYEHFKDAIMFGREQTITLEEVHTSIRTKESYKRIEIKNDNNAEILNGHFKKDFPEINESRNSQDSGNVALVDAGYESTEALMISNSEGENNWNLLNGDKIEKLEFCDHCILGKSKRGSFGVDQHNTSRPFEYTHSDLWGPSRTKTHAGCSYFLTIIDDYSRKVWIYVIKSKSDTFMKFKEWHMQIETQKETKLKCLRTDNGLKYLSEQFNKYFRDLCIQRHRTVAGTPQQNGIAERMNRTILERVRCMILSVGLPKTFGGEAAVTTVYLINRCPSSSIGFKTQIEMWNGKPADYSNLKVFGSLAFAHTRNEGHCRNAEHSPFQFCRNAEHSSFQNCRNAERSPVNSASNNNGESVQIEVESPEDQEINHEDIIDTSLDGNVAIETDLVNYNLVRDKERKVIKPPIRYGEADLICYTLSVAEDLQRDEPNNYREAINGEDKEAWMTAMIEEMQSLEKNQT